MKVLYSEFEAKYQKYEFPYQVYGVLEKGDNITNIFNDGFLPSRIDKRLFYLARSTRVSLAQFTLSSENRRILNKTDYISVEEHELKDFRYEYQIGKLAVDFYKGRFGETLLSAQAVKRVFTDSFYTHTLVFKDRINSRTIGYCPIFKNPSLIHYAYPFYDIDYFKKNLGMGMMLNTLVRAQDQGLSHVYLGTAYNESSLYKTQFEGFQFFDGIRWNSDITILKSRIKNIPSSHLFSEIEDKSEFINQLFKGEDE